MELLKKHLQDAMNLVDSMMKGENKTSPDLPESDMPGQEMDAEEGDYSGKGLMAKDSALEEKKKMIMAAMKKKGY